MVRRAVDDRIDMFEQVFEHGSMTGTSTADEARRVTALDQARMLLAQVQKAPRDLSEQPAPHLTAVSSFDPAGSMIPRATASRDGRTSGSSHAERNTARNRSAAPTGHPATTGATSWRGSTGSWSAARNRSSLVPK